MSKLLLIIAATFIPWCALANADNEQFKPSTEQMRKLVLAHKNLLISLADDQEIIEFLKQHGQCVSSLEGIIEKNVEWPLARGLREQVTTNSVAKRFQTIIENKQYGIDELILTDALGATLASYPATSDYWQADEAKFYEPMRRADVYVSEATWDYSSESHTFFIALPIKPDDEIVGVLIAGLNVSLEHMMKLRLEDLIKLPIKK